MSVEAEARRAASGVEARPDADLVAAARAELACLWSDLEQAIRNALNRAWSMECINLVERIGRLTRHVGPCSWREVPLPLSENGVWVAVHEGLCVTVDPPEAAELAAIRADIERMHRN